MAPLDNDARKEFLELIPRSQFYFGLEDKYLQEELCKVKAEDESLKKFMDEATVAEQRRKSFLEIGVSGSQLDSSSRISVNAWSGGGSHTGGN